MKIFLVHLSVTDWAKKKRVIKNINIYSLLNIDHLNQQRTVPALAKAQHLPIHLFLHPFIYPSHTQSNYCWTRVWPSTSSKCVWERWGVCTFVCLSVQTGTSSNYKRERERQGYACLFVKYQLQLWEGKRERQRGTNRPTNRQIGGWSVCLHVYLSVCVI